MKTLVVYYSFLDATKAVAAEVANEIGADLKRTNAVGLDVSGYDLIVLGTPLWGGKPSWPVKNFLGKNDLAGKRVAFFCTTSVDRNNTVFAEIEGFTSGKVISKKSFIASWMSKVSVLPKARDWANSLK